MESREGVSKKQFAPAIPRTSKKKRVIGKSSVSARKMNKTAMATGDQLMELA